MIKHGDPDPIGEDNRYIQADDQLAPGFYVSHTSLKCGTDEKDPNSYVNAEEINFVVLPCHQVVLPDKSKHLQLPKDSTLVGVTPPVVQLGDVAAVYNRKNRQLAYAIFADVGSLNQIGEGSIALAKALGSNGSPLNGTLEGSITYVIFPNSGDGTCKSNDEIQALAEPLFTAWGGTARIEAMFAGGTSV